MKHDELRDRIKGVMGHDLAPANATALSYVLEELDQRLSKLEESSGRVTSEALDLMDARGRLEELEHRVTCMDGGPESSDEELPRKPLSEEEPKPFREGGPRDAQASEPTWYTQRHVDALQKAGDHFEAQSQALRSRLAQAENLLAKVTDFATGGHPDDIADFLKNTPHTP